jgi:hypothetical protein
LGLVKEAFPILQSYPDERIEFFHSRDGHWSKILRESFTDIAELKPDTIKVQVADAPGDRRKRMSHKQSLIATGSRSLPTGHARVWIIVISSVLGGLFAFWLLIFIMVTLLR